MSPQSAYTCYILFKLSGTGIYPTPPVLAECLGKIQAHTALVYANWHSLKVHAQGTIGDIILGLQVCTVRKDKILQIAEETIKGQLESWRQGRHPEGWSAYP